MPRKPRIQYPGAIYHVMSRGDRREDIFLDDVDRYDFLKTLAEACQKTSWQVHAYCLMKNHFHLVVDGSGEGYLKSVCDYVHSRAQAERMIAEELAALGWTESELSSRRKNDPAKLELAARLRRETTWTTKQIAARLSLGTPKSATTALHRWMRNNPQASMESGALRRETGK